jgi:AcrR family transcriptional regulator
MEGTRRYELKERAVKQAETRQRIIDAALTLHREVGPARTTISEVARRAGVGRVTVYNHFPDDASLLGASTAQFAAQSPPPEPDDWTAIRDPEERLRSALAELYGYYRDNEAMLENVGRDVGPRARAGARGVGRGEARGRDGRRAGGRPEAARQARAAYPRGPRARARVRDVAAPDA